MSKVKNNTTQRDTDTSRENPSEKNSLKTLVSLVGSIAAFLAGSFIFYQVGKDSLSNNCEGEKILLMNKIDSLRQEQLSLHAKVSCADKNMQNCINKNDSIMNENDKLNRLITESKDRNQIKIASLIKTGKSLLENTELIQNWRNECISFLENNYKKEVANYKKVTDYPPAKFQLRKKAIENGIDLLRTLK
jgi:hypothetical protein